MKLVKLVVASTHLARWINPQHIVSVDPSSVEPEDVGIEKGPIAWVDTTNGAFYAEGTPEEVADKINEALDLDVTVSGKSYDDSLPVTIRQA